MTVPNPDASGRASGNTFHGPTAFQAGDGNTQNNHYYAAPTPVAALRTLPRDVAAFTGRKAELDRLLAAADSANALPILTIDGMAGVGKTALVTHAAHLLAPRFPDGQLFVRLHAHAPDQHPADTSEVLAAFLSGIGIAPQYIPNGLDARATLWRDHLADRKVLLVLDDVADRAQIEPLLPASDSSLVLVTSRRRLLALDNAVPLPLETLRPQEAELLFARLAHRIPTETDVEAVADVVELCGYLPLAIALLAGRLAHHPTWNLAQFATAFTHQQDRLGELSSDDRAVAAAFDLSYRDLPADRQHLFRRLGLHPGPDIDTHATAALNRTSLAQARHHLQALYTDHLVDEPAPGRYRLHDLLRSYARTLVQQDPAGDRERATKRLLDYYQHAAEETARQLAGPTRQKITVTIARRLRLPRNIVDKVTPALTTQAQAKAWLRTERLNLLACVEH
ncbi:NB-ARC domain-containing protein [Streptomyces sp. NPDC059862]|uniref:NB-ARC domain-containing protein n=1 Tax=Streptomyces sp. NPDC059862 TaxID=3346975 RepID=UPI003648E6C9